MLTTMALRNLNMALLHFRRWFLNFLPVDFTASDEEMNEAFFCCWFCDPGIERLKQRFAYTVKCQTLVKRRWLKEVTLVDFWSKLSHGLISLSLGRATPCAVCHHAIWETQTLEVKRIPPNLSDRMKVRRPLPEKWAGLRDEELKDVSGNFLS